VRSDLPALGNGCGGSDILDAGVGAGADEDLVDLEAVQRHVGLEAHVAEATLHGNGCDICTV
jgi:hypothetical protein